MALVLVGLFVWWGACDPVQAAVLVVARDGSSVSKPSIAAANTADDVAGKTVRITSATTLTSNVAWRKDATLAVDRGASIVLNGYTLTGLKYAEPEWFGARGDGAVNDAGAIQHAVNSLASGGRLLFNTGPYLVNTQISLTTDSLTVEFGKATILNTAAMPQSVWAGQTINPIWLISASNIVLSGGVFKDLVSQGLFAGGPFARRGAQGNTKRGVTFRDMRFSNLVVSTLQSRSIQTRHVDDVTLEGIVAENIGAARADKQSHTLSVNYAVRASVTKSVVTNMNEGGAVNFLYVDDGKITGNRFTGMRNPRYLYAIGLHVKASNRIVVSDNVIAMDHGGMAMKISENANEVLVTKNTITVTGPQEYMYAGIFVQGASKFNVADNRLDYGGGPAILVGPHKKVTSRDGAITKNRITTTYGAGDRKIKGSGIHINGGNTDQERLPIVVTDNHLYNADIYMFQALNSSVTGNVLVSDHDFVVTGKSATRRAIANVSAAIFVENGSFNTISKNRIDNRAAAPDTERIGIRVVATANSVVADNEVVFAPGSRLSTGYQREVSNSTVFKGNKATNAAAHGARDGDGPARVRER